MFSCKRFIVVICCYLSLIHIGVSAESPVMGLWQSSLAYAAPMAPTNVRSFQTMNAIRVAWDPSSDATVARCNIYRSTDQTTYVNIGATTAPTDRTFDDSSVQNGVSYYYKVNFTDISGVEGPLSPLTATTYHYLQVTQFAPGAATVAAIGDLNGDGKPDLAVGLPYPSAAGNPLKGKTYPAGKVDIYLGGSGKTTPSMTLAGEVADGNFGASLVITDLNKDGFDDLVIAAPMAGNGKLYLYKGSSRFGTTPVLTISGGPSPDSLSGCQIANVGDVNGDGYPDIAIGASIGGTNFRGQVKVLLGGSVIANNMITLNGTVDDEEFGSTVNRTGDVNGDGFADILASGGNKYFLVYGGNTLSLAPTAFPTGYFGNSALAGVDFNGDGSSDIVANMDGVGNIYYGGMALDAKPDIIHGTTNAWIPHFLGDIDKDGYEDFFDQQLVHFGTGSTTEIAAIYSSDAGAIGVGDIDKDGLKEIVSCDGFYINVTSFPSLRNLPVVSLSAPLSNNMTVSSESLTIAGTVTGGTALLIAGQPATLAADGSFQEALHLKNGLNIIELIAKAADGRIGKRVIRVTYNVPPLTIAISSPQHGGNAASSTTVTGTVSDPDALVTVNDAPVQHSGTSFQTTVNLSTSLFCNAIVAKAYDVYGQSASSNVTVMVLPKGRLYGYLTEATTGTPISSALVSLVTPLESLETSTTSSGYYSVYLAPADFTARFSKDGYAAQTASGTVVSEGEHLLNAALNPVPPLLLTIAAPVNGATVAASPIAVSGTVTNNAEVTVNGASANVVAGSYSATAQLNEGLNTITVSGTDSYGQQTSKTVVVTLASSGNLSGTVTDSLNSLPITAAAISVLDSAGTPYSTTTNSEGYFALNALKPGSFSGTISTAGYVTGTISGAITAGQTMIRDLALERIVPNFSSFSAADISTTSAVISWTTDQPATGFIEYGETASYSSNVTEPTSDTQHVVTLTGLNPGASYHYRITATNGFGFSATTADQTVTMPVFSAKHLSDSGNVAVLEVEGNMDARNPDGSINALARQEIANEYIRTHGDTLDFLVFLSSFDYAMPEATAKGYYLEVKNDTQGINRAIFDNSAQFGSAGRLQGTIDLGNVTTLAANPYESKLDETVTTLNHELTHRFGAYVRFKNTDGTLNTALLGKDNAHWSYLLDSKGSLMYGSGWRDNGDGTFTATSARNAFSPLDLYLMGMIPKEQVPPMLLIDNPAIEKTQLPHLGDTITGTARTVTIDDIIAAEGARVPDASTSPKRFNVGFVLIQRPGDNATSALAAIETLRNAWAGRFAELSQGIGGVNGVAPSLSVVIDSPADGATVTGPDVTVTGTVINSTGAETGIVVNGIPATVTGSRFVVNHLPLVEGANTITINATDANGLTATATKNVTAAAGNYIRIVPNVESGTAPLDVSIQLDGSFSIANPTMTTSGPVPITLTQGANSTEYTAQFTVEGVYTITASAVGPDGQTYSYSVSITVFSQTVIDNLLRSKWTSINTNLLNENIPAALSNFLYTTRDKYQAVFDEVAPLLPSILATYQGLTTSNIESNIASYKLTTLEGVKRYAYDIVFVKDENGLWRLRSY